jgi:hypothetical protein
MHVVYIANSIQLQLYSAYACRCFHMRVAIQQINTAVRTEHGVPVAHLLLLPPTGNSKTTRYCETVSSFSFAFSFCYSAAGFYV